MTRDGKNMRHMLVSSSASILWWVTSSSVNLSGCSGFESRFSNFVLMFRACQLCSWACCWRIANSFTHPQSDCAWASFTRSVFRLVVQFLFAILCCWWGDFVKFHLSLFRAMNRGYSGWNWSISRTNSSSLPCSRESSVFFIFQVVFFLFRSCWVHLTFWLFSFARIAGYPPLAARFLCFACQFLGFHFKCAVSEFQFQFLNCSSFVKLPTDSSPRQCQCLLALSAPRFTQFLYSKRILSCRD